MPFPAQPEPKKKVQEESRQKLCVQALLQGNVQAYVDFFYLTHQPGNQPLPPHAPAPHKNQASDQSLPNANDLSLPTVVKHLQDAENARRNGNLVLVYDAFKALADFYASRQDHRTTIYFSGKCLEVSKLEASSDLEKSAMRGIGKAYEADGDIISAIEHFERLLALAKETGDELYARLSNEHLVNTYEAMASAKEAGGDLEGSLEYRDLRLVAARASADDKAVLCALIEIAKTYEKLGKDGYLQKARITLDEYLQLAEKLNDTDAQGLGCFALGRIFQRMEDTDASLVQLKRYL